MKKILTLLLLALTAIVSYAQDETIDLTAGVKSQGNITLTYPSYTQGALVAYVNRPFYTLKIQSSSLNIAHIELEGTPYGKNSNVNLGADVGTLAMDAEDISRWDGKATSITISGNEQAAGYYFTTMRIWYEGTPFTPTDHKQGEGAKLDLGGSPADVHYYAHAATLPKDGKAVRMAFIYHSMFRDALQDYMVWKTKQGYDVVELCADEIGAATGKRGDDLAMELRSRMMAMNPRPAYILLCGDTDEVPYFQNRTAMAGGSEPNPPTDFFYGEFTGDFFAEAYVGRYSAYTVEQLQAQMEKTEYMARINPNEAGWLSHSCIAHGPADDISTEKGKDFGEQFPLQFEGNTTSVVYYSGSISREINEGCSQIAYLGHGWWHSWSYSGYSRGHVTQLTNKNKYPVVLGLTCLSGAYHYNECLAESFMRQKDGGAVAYIGASRESWDGSDNLFFTGGDNGTKSYRHIGYMRSLYHPMEEDESQLSRTIGEAFYIGKSSDRFLGEFQPFRQFMEFFTLFGDPTYQPYITVPKQMFITPASASVAAGHEITLHTAPEAVVCISLGRHVVAVGMADKAGDVTLKLPVDAPVGECTLYSSAPFYNDYETTITITAGDNQEFFRPVEQKLPYVQYADVIDLESAASAIENPRAWPSTQPASFSVGGPAEYTMWVSTNLIPGTNGTQYCDWANRENDVMRGLYIRNKYDSCSFITTKTAGNVAYVSVDWLNDCGQTEILGVYGSKTAYYSTSQAWNGGAGTKLGEIRKGQNDYLVLEEQYPYIMLRAENLTEKNNDQNDVFLKSITIGWNRIEESAPIRNITISEFGSTTLALQEAYTMPEGMRGVIVSAKESASHAGEYDITLTTKYQSGDVVPAGECLVLKGAPGTYALLSGTTEAVPATYPANLLRADYKSSGSKYLTSFYNYATAFERYYYYKLTTKEGRNFGWYYGAEDGAPFLMSSAERAYLVLDREIASSVRSFSLDDCTEEQTTGIGVLSSKEGQGVNACFDLTGRSYVRHPKSAIIIQGGKKVIK